MQLKTFSVPFFAAAAVSAAAVPQADAPQPIPEGRAFNLISLRSGSEAHLSPVSAAKSNLFLHLKDQGASCGPENPNDATFVLKDGQLDLYTGGATPQRVYADRSGMGQGKVGYVTGAQQPPRNGELTGWALDESNNLTLDGSSWIACPGYEDGAWGMWISAGVNQPGGNSGCEGVSLRAYEVENPLGCWYTS